MKCPNCGFEFNTKSTPTAENVICWLKRTDKERELYLGRYGRWYITYATDDMKMPIPKKIVVTLFVNNLTKSKYPDTEIENEVYVLRD